MYRNLLSLLVLVIFVIPLHAQTDTPLIAFFNDQLYQLEGDALMPFDACMPDEEIAGDFIPSPDGTRFLIGTYARVISEALNAMGSLGDIPYGLNYWLCDIRDNSLERIILQPGADEPFEGDLPALDYVSGRINWSPDGTQLAWTQLDFRAEQESIVVHDLASGERTEFVIDIPPAPFPAPADLIAWTGQGIILWVFEFDDVNFFNVESIAVVDVGGQAIQTQYEVLNGGEDADFYNQRVLVQTADGLKFAIDFAEQGWVLIDIVTGTKTPVSGRPAYFSSANPDGIQVPYEIDFEYNYNWRLPDGTILRAYPPSRVALSPDGSQVAYADSTLHIYNQNGTITDVVNSDGFADDSRARLFWGPADHTFVELEDAGLAPPASCEGAPPISLAEGDIGRVISQTVPNRMRSLPTTSSAIVGEIVGGDQFIVRGGPVCAEGYTWFQVEYNGTVGWTVEGSGAEYYLEPLPE